MGTPSRTPTTTWVSLLRPHKFIQVGVPSARISERHKPIHEPKCRFDALLAHRRARRDMITRGVTAPSPCQRSATAAGMAVNLRSSFACDSAGSP